MYYLPRKIHRLGCATENFNRNALWKLSRLLLVLRGRPCTDTMSGPTLCNQYLHNIINEFKN